MRKITEAAFKKRDLRSMRLIAREVDAMTIGLAPHQREGLEALLKARLGGDREAERLEKSRRVAAIVERGTIASERERRNLEDYLEMLQAIGGDPKEAESIRRLLREA